MKIFRLMHLALITLLLVAGCSKDDNDPAPPDPRTAFVGEYEAESHKSRVMNSQDLDSTFTIAAGSEIEIKLLPGTSGEIEIDLEEFIRDIILVMTVSAFTVDFDEDVIAEVSGDNYEMESTEFEVIAGGSVLQGEISGEGELDDDELIMEYEFSLTDGLDIITLSGEVTFEQQ